ncbi:hypothetical protein [Fulvitalea axinellae]
MYITERETGNTVPVTVETVGPDDLPRPAELCFDWRLEHREGAGVYGLKTGDGNLVGLISLRTDRAPNEVHVKLVERIGFRKGAPGPWKGIAQAMLAFAAKTAREAEKEPGAAYLTLVTKTELYRFYSDLGFVTYNYPIMGLVDPELDALIRTHYPENHDR